MRTAYPTETDLLELLQSSGFELAPPLAARLRGLAEAGRLAVERATSRRFLPVEEARTFDPPEPPGHLLFVPDVLEVTEITWRDRVLEADEYHLEPRNSPAHGDPYTSIRFRLGSVGPMGFHSRGSVVIDATWGYSETVPEDVWQAMLAQAGLLAFPALQQMTTGGILSWSDGGRSINYGVERWSSLRDSWQQNVTAVVRQYRRLTL